MNDSMSKPPRASFSTLITTRPSRPMCPPTPETRWSSTAGSTSTLAQRSACTARTLTPRVAVQTRAGSCSRGTTTSDARLALGFARHHPARRLRDRSHNDFIDVYVRRSRDGEDNAVGDVFGGKWLQAFVNRFG